MKSRRPGHGNRGRRPRQAAAVPTEPVTLTIDGYIHDGRGLARHQGQAVFVSGALDSEQVEARWTKRQSRFSEARLLQVLSPSPQRVEPACKHYGRCGGCQLQHASHAHQLEIKQNSVLDQLARAGAPAPQTLLPPIVGNPWHYRSRARLAVMFDKAGQLSFGFRRQGDSQLVNIEQCPVLPESLQGLIEPLRVLLQQLDVKAVSHVELIATQDQSVVILRHTRALKAEACAALTHFAESQCCQVWLSPDNQQLTDIAGEPLDPRLSFALVGGSLELRFHPLDFTQVNPEINRAMVDQAVRLLDPQTDEHVLDLFCGIGNFSLPLAQQAGRVTGVEAIKSMVARAGENAQSNQLSNLDFIAADLEQASLKTLQKKIGQFHAVLLDPPRAGAALACQQLAETAAKRILYVSCNPATLARDAHSLTQAGFSLDSLGIMEMFPHTSHVETMALFTRR
ncbi:23S rRNA (uracil(1939)-C(5))-methyltransferase RlmD [Gilvimarinus sp. 1_MG-2023]|uniref:23S rRNA (uracil(1939)-C(5))-methyltransferase RlmD n=1 Tax=Gilvimarinus sp. 1_MG-2023 TaxID=3062638 RepID=UPI0026E35412|nr:23S rRNA (uracil(1939)-C(5))-methyltransferase RlmD [Gilvimarinus sp. 1_MG-2023]MDO6747151.1 23S rRNA (uracil(1939)-C(5))-methyltransferase RlmD [Gilvimarinus sp. 1_MG-2023]